MKSTGYYIVQGWMVNELGLKGNNLILFALIYGFSQDGENKYTGSLKYLQGCLNSSKNTILNALDYLLDSGLILKESDTYNSVKFCKYFHNDILVQKLVGGGSKTALGGGSNFGINNTIIDNSINSNITKEKMIEFFKKLKPSEQKELAELLGLGKAAGKVFFKDSKWCDYDYLRNHLAEDKLFVEKFTRVDLKHYIEKCDTWSETSNNGDGTKRTERGWYKTLRDWMNDAQNTNTLVKIPEKTTAATGHINH